MPRLMTLVRTLRHHRPAQLLRRALGTVREHLQRTFPALATPPRGPELPLAEQPPLPLFALREFSASASGGITLLGRPISLVPGLDWHPAGPRLDTMTLHYMEWLEGLEAEVAERWVLDWIARNPAQAPTARWAAWHAYVLSLRVVVWMQTWARLGWRPPEQTVIRGAILAQLRALNRRLEFDLGGNHLLKNLKALFWGAAFFSGEEPTRWFHRAKRLLERELRTQILPDGLHFERSPAYHLQVLADLLEIRHVWPGHIACPALEDALDRMAQVAADLTHPDGLPSQFGDGGLHMTYSPQACLAAYQALRGRTVQPRPAFALPQGGYAGLRQGSSLVLWNFGRLGAEHLPAHGHGDMLALEWSLEGQRILVDMGVFAYEPGPDRDRCRGTFGHNTITIEGADQGEFWGSFRLGRRACPVLDQLVFRNGQLEASAHHAGYDHLPGHPVHHRRLVTDGRRIEVIDRIASTSPVQAQATFLLHPACVPVGSAVFDTPVGRIGFETTGSWELRDFAWCPDFGVRHPTHLLVIEFESTAPVCRTLWQSLL
jgi:uncharacterized heparinase superfamily protein